MSQSSQAVLSTFTLPSVPAATGSVYDPSYWAFHRNDKTVFFTTDTFQLDASTAFDTNGLYIWAENILIASPTLSFPGKDIALFCRTITIAPSLSEGVTIDTSGLDGDNAVVGDDNANTGQPGSPAGSIQLFVQDLFDTSFGDFTFKANGGNGGNGVVQADATSQEQGGTGGAPGKAGQITIQYGSTPARLGVQIANAQASTPAQMFSALKASMDQNRDDWTELGVDIPAFESIKVADTSFAGTVNSVVQALNITISYTSNPRQILNNAQNLQSQLQAALTTTSPPYFDDSAITSLDNLLKVMNKWNSNGYIYQKPTDVKKTLNALNAVNVPVASAAGSSSLTEAVVDLRKKVSSAFARTRIDVMARCQVKGAALASQVAGTLPDGKINVRGLKFDQSDNDAAFLSPIVMPDQAQMLLDQADGYYFEFTDSSKVAAVDLYQTLIERLSVVANKNANPMFERAVNGLSREGITFNPIPELTRILGTAKTRLSQLLMSVDMFGHQFEWAPRLTFGIYHALAQKRLDTVRDLETAFNSLTKQMQQQSDAKDTISKIASTVANGQQEAQDRMDYLDSKTGPLRTAASTIAGFNPILVQKHALAADLLPKIETDIENKFNFDWATALDSFASFAAVPSVLGGLANSVSTLYKFENSVEDSNGNWVDKKNVVSSFQDAGSDLSSMVNTYTGNIDGTLSVDDAGFAKLVGDQSTLESLLQTYKSGIDDKLSDAFKDAIDAYVAAAQSRNAAVLDYNSAVQSYIQAKKDLVAAQSVSQTDGENQLLQDPTLPSNTQWVKRRLNTEKLAMMQYLNYGSRAVQYWSASLDHVARFTTGPLADYEQLKENLEILEKEFQNALENYGGSTLTSFPYEETDPGMFLKLTDSDIDALKMFQKGNQDQGTQDRYETQFRVPHPAEGESAKTDEQDDRSLFISHCNVRIQQVRVWLPGATVDQDSDTASHFISISLEHNGTEILYTDSENGQNFTHDPISYDFTYRSKGMSTEHDIKQWRAGPRQIPLSSQYTMDGTEPAPDAYAPVGPFTTWTITLLSDANPGLNLSKVTDGYMELHYWYNPCGTLYDVNSGINIPDGFDDD